MFFAAETAVSPGIEGLAFDALRQMPAVVALIVVVWYFLKHITDSNTRAEKVEEKRAQMLRELGDVCHSFQEKMSQRNESLMLKVSDALDRNTATLSKAVMVLDHYHDAKPSGIETNKRVPK